MQNEKHYFGRYILRSVLGLVCCRVEEKLYGPQISKRAGKNEDDDEQRGDGGGVYSEFSTPSAAAVNFLFGCCRAKMQGGSPFLVPVKFYPRLQHIFFLFLSVNLHITTQF